MAVKNKIAGAYGNVFLQMDFTLKPRSGLSAFPIKIAEHNITRAKMSISKLKFIPGNYMESEFFVKGYCSSISYPYNQPHPFLPT